MEVGGGRLGEVLELTFSAFTADPWYLFILSNTEWSAQPPSDPYLWGYSGQEKKKTGLQMTAGHMGEMRGTHRGGALLNQASLKQK